ncbi:Amidophosphoribosyltransferase [Trichoderma barbatum]
MCGVTGLMLGDPEATSAAVELHESLFYLQHRGQDAAGIAVCSKGRVYQRKGLGMAQKVFSEFDGQALLDQLPGNFGIAHVRYPTAGTSSASEAQPLYVNSPFGLSISVNGNIINPDHLRRFLDDEAHRHVNSDSDSELLLNVFAYGLNKTGKRRADYKDIFEALKLVYEECIGAFACTAMVAGYGIVGFRDANGIRPLCYGSRVSLTNKYKKDYFLASESVALRQLGFTDITDIKPGQAVFFPKNGGDIQKCDIVEPKSYTPDIFEYVYLARPDSCIDGISVHRSRQNMGARLAEKMKKVLTKKELEDIDVVIPAPETSNTAAATLASSLGRPYSNAFVKNRYANISFVFRTFILPGQDARKKGIRRKLSPIESEFQGKNICIVDDSIVRGNTSREIVQMAREAGATRVYVVSCSPEIMNQHIYGIDLADPDELVAYNKTTQEVAESIHADKVIFQSLDDLKAACIESAPVDNPVKEFEVGVFSGKYITEVPYGYFEHISELRGKNKKRKTKNNSAAMLIANGGVVNVAPGQVAGDARNGDKTPSYREDIK